jgi:hypothetical protein
MEIDELIAKYPKIFQDYHGNPGQCNWRGLPDGWIKNVDILCGAIQSYIDFTKRYDNETDKWVHPPQVTCTQMKEKFGGLRFYFDGGDKQIEGMVEMAEYMCENTCQDCGSTENIGFTQSWITTLCQTCVIAQGDRAMADWKPKIK